MDAWRFDPDDRLLVWFQEDLLQLLEWPGAAEMVRKKLEEMQRRGGMVGNAVMLGDVVVHLAKTPPMRPPLAAPALVLAFLVNQKDRILRPMLVCRADEVSLENAGDASSPAEAPREPIEKRIRRRLEGPEPRDH